MPRKRQGIAKGVSSGGIDEPAEGSAWGRWRAICLEAPRAVVASRRTREWALFEQCLPMLKTYVRRRVSNREYASDVIQEVSLQILRGPAPWERSRFVAWSRGVARHVISHQWRLRRRALAETPLEVGSMERAGASPPDTEAYLDARAWVARIHRDFDRDEIELLVRRYVLEETGRELADELAQSPARLRMRLMRLRTAIAGKRSRGAGRPFREG